MCPSAWRRGNPVEVLGEGSLQAGPERAALPFGSRDRIDEPADRHTGGHDIVELLPGSPRRTEELFLLLGRRSKRSDRLPTAVVHPGHRQGHAQLLGQGPQDLVVFFDPLPTELGHLAVAQDHGANAPPHAVPGLEDGYRVSTQREAIRGGEPGQSGSGHDDRCGGGEGLHSPGAHAIRVV